MKTNKYVCMTYLILTIMIPLFIACGGGQTANTSDAVQIRKIGNLEYGVVEGDVQSTANAMSGTGKVLFRNQLPDEDNRFALTMELQPGGSITFTTNSDTQLSTGIQITMRRDGANQITGEMKDGSLSEDLSSVLSTVDGSKPFSVQFEVHPHGHLIFVDGAKRTEFDFRSRPTGKFWGIALQSATVSAAALQSVEGE